MKYLIVLLSFFFITNSFGQKIPTPESLGFRHLQTIFQKDTVDILVKSKKGEEQKVKPLFLFVQGSEPMPLIMYDSSGTFGTLPFKEDSLLQDYHVVIIGKPFVPLISDTKYLDNNYGYIDPVTKKTPDEYYKRNYLDYYVQRNLTVIDYLQKQPWVSKNKLVVAGHSEGSHTVVKMASISPKITALIYLGGNPMGRIMSVIENSRKTETDSNRIAYHYFDYWADVIASPNNEGTENGNTHRTNYGFSASLIEYFQKITIPVFVAYGTKDDGAPYDDYLHVEMMRKKKTNFTFMAYIGREHNFYIVKPNGETDYTDVKGWDMVSMDWYYWLKTK